jgi:outer membrane protein OmpA-like peptidoglycan-associated protein
MNIHRFLLLLPLAAALTGCSVFQGDLGDEEYDDAQDMLEHPRRTEIPSPFGPGSERLRGGQFPPVKFSGSSWQIPPAEQVKLKSTAKWLKGNPHRVLLTAGATSAESPEYARQLSDLRAQAVRQALIGDGVPAERILTASYGEDVPSITGDGVAFSLIRTGEE